MRKINNYMKQGMIVLFTAALMFGAANKTIAQTCNQVEITYKEPDCFKSKGTEGAIGPGQGRACTPVTVCVNQLYTYSAGPGWASYQWVITSGPATPPINPNATSANVSINWPLVGTYILTLTVTDAGGNSFTKCLEITVKDKPSANFTFNFNNACVGSTVNFINGTTFSGTPSYSWNFGDPTSPNNTSNLQDPSHIFSGAGTYTVTLIAYSSMLVPSGGGNPQHGDSLSLVTCCADTIKKTVTVVAGNVKIECISTVCAGDTATYTAVGCGSPSWGTPIGGVTIGTSGNQITVVWGNGNPQGQLSVNCGGCTAYVTVPIVPSTPIIVGNNAPCNTNVSTYSVPYLPGTFYTWTLTDITTATNANNLLNTYPDNNTVFINWANAVPGDTYQLTILLDNKHLCCQSTGSLNITPKQKFTVTGPASICAGQTTSFSTNPSGTFNWAVAPTTGVTPTTATGTASYTAAFATAGTFVITATDVSSAFCNLTASASVIVVPVPPIGIMQGPDSICLNGQYAYNMSPGAPPGYYYEWTISGGSFQPGNITPIVSGDNVTVLWTGYGTLSVVLKQSAAPFCQVTGPSKTVKASIVGAVSGTLNVCVDGSGSYTLTGSTLAPSEVITWTISPSSHGTITAGQGTNTITVLWHGQGGAGPWGPVTISASTLCGPATPLPGIMIYPKFTLSIATSGIDVCQPAGLTLTANGAPGGATFNWVPGGPGQTITVNTPGSYTVTATAGGCVFSKTINIPDPFQIIPVTCGVGTCNGLNTNEQLAVQVVKPGAGVFTYQWYSGTYPSGTLIPSATTANYLATAPGPYYVVVTYGICTKYVTFNVAKVCCPDVNNPTITNVTQITCNQYSFTATTPNPTGATITWDFGDGSTAPGASGVPILHTYAHAGVYCVKFCVGPPSPNPTNCAGNCVATTVTVPIEASFLYVLGCNGCVDIVNTSTVIISAPASVTYNWNYGDGNFSNVQNPPQHCYAPGGPYTITLTITYNNNALPAITCTSTATQTFTYTPLSISNTAPVCTGVPVQFSSNPGGFVTYNWNFGDGGTAYTSPISHSFANPGSSIITLIVTDQLGNTCTAKDTVNIFAGISSCTILPAFICPGSSATLSTNVVAPTYLWEVETNTPGVFVPAPGTNSNSTYNTIVPGNYHVVITNANGCKCISNTVAVTAVAKPKASFTVSPSLKLCAPGGMVMLTASQVSGYTYSWHNVVGMIYGASIGGSPMLSTFVGSTTTFGLIVTNQYGCKDTCVMTVVVNAPPPPPIIQTLPSGTLCEGVPITLTVNNYGSNITWNNGATTPSITVYTAGTYIATYTDPLTGCSSNAKVTVNRRPSAGLFPHFCDSIPCDCIRPFVIYAPNPLIGLFASNYNINWYNANTNALLGSGPSYNNGGLGAQTGSYYIIITDQTTGCKDTSNNYSIVVPKCDTCDCKGSTWGDILLTEGDKAAKNNLKANVGGNPIKLSCGKPVTLDCKKTYTINASYNCKDSTCPGKVTYSLQPPVGLPTTGNAPLTFTPNQSGTYILTLYGWCGGKKCDSCIIDIIVKCDSCDCKESKWGNITLSKGIPENPNGVVGSTGNPVIDPAALSLSCKKTYKIDCNKPYSFNANYICKDSACNGKVTYSLQPPVGVAITGNVAGSFTPTQTGIYTLTLYGWCGGKICDSCVIKFDVKCDSCDCKESKWGKITLSKGNIDNPDDPGVRVAGNPKVIIDPNAISLVCKKTYKLDCNKPYTFNASYICKDSALCPSQVTYSLQPPTGPAITGNVAASFTPTQSGIYTLTLYGWCGGKICDSCVIKFEVKCDPCDCKESKWGKITLAAGNPDNPNPVASGNPKVVIDPVAITLGCNKSYKLDCNKPYSVNASYICKDPNCPGKVTYSLQPPSGPAITGNMALNFTPVLNGTYTLTLYGWCGNTICDSCVIKFDVTCVEGCDCKGSHWGEIMLNTGGAKQAVNCGKTYDIKCKTAFTVNANYICADPACPGTVTYKFTPVVGASTTGNVPFTYMPTQSGLYTLVLYGWCGNKICDSCVIKFKVDDCPPPDCCPYTITVKEPSVQLSTISNPDATVANGNFSITGPAGNLFTEIRAEVVSYNLFSNFNNECLSCKSYPFTWASIYQAGAIGAMQPKITMYNSTASSFNPAGNGMYQNPREVIWSGPPFAIPNNINMQFLLPPASVIDCCELSAKICVKFTFRGRDCKECQALVCFTVVIKKK